MIFVDGSQGEGGGQVLRSSLALSAITGQTFTIEEIRARRSIPGLRAQHLQAVKAAAAICRAEVEGAVIDSTRLVFKPGPLRSGRFRFDVGTAGSTSLVLQTVFLPLCFARGTSYITISGGTHVPFSPPYHYLEWVWLPVLTRMGCRASLSLDQAGYNPGGGGLISAVIRPAGELSPLQLTERGQLKRISGLSGASNLDPDIPKRQKLQALRRLEPVFPSVRVKDMLLPSPSTGTFIALLAQFEESQACFSALGVKGKRAEQVANEAVDSLEAFLSAGAAVDPHLADQLLLPAAFASGASRLSTSAVTSHLQTNAAVIQLFLPVGVKILGEAGAPGIIEVSGGFQRGLG